jgi:hypothetical protein
MIERIHQKEKLERRFSDSCAACIINTGPADHEAGALLVSWAAMIGQCVLIETECAAWADWFRLVLALKPDLAVGLRIPPDQVVPDDLVGKIDYSLEKSQSTKH